MIELIGIIFLSIEILVLKNISYNKNSYDKPPVWIVFKLKIWHLIILIFLNLYWILSMITFAFGTIMFFISFDDFKINYNKDSSIFKFLNKEL